ncbi:hypothetical protein L1887_60796 [Cichorium endivia]|nr:hypothetical protein L1887_60796 [Cichorium endivia]
MNFKMSPAACCLATTLVATLRDDSVSGCRVRCIHLDSTAKDELPYAKRRTHPRSASAPASVLVLQRPFPLSCLGGFPCQTDLSFVLLGVCRCMHATAVPPVRTQLRHRRKGVDAQECALHNAAKAHPMPAPQRKGLCNPKHGASSDLATLSSCGRPQRW